MAVATVRLTESRIPAGFTAQDLGEAMVAGDFALVSYLTSPIAVGSTVTYVVFSTKSEGDTYKWRFSAAGAKEVEEEETDVGVFEYDATSLGGLKVDVTILAEGRVLRTLSLKQQVIPTHPALEILLEPAGLQEHLSADSDIGALGGNPDASRELVNAFRGYIFSAVKNRAVPARLLGALVYAQLLRTPRTRFGSWLVPELSRDAELEAAGDELNGASLSSFRVQLDNALGVCQITIPTLAMLRGTGGVAWRDWPATDAGRSQRDTELAAILTNLSLEQKIDLYNLLRFPKTNIRMGAELLDRLRNRAHRWPASTAAQLLGDKPALEVLTTEFYVGPTTSPRPTTPAQPGQAQPNDTGKHVINLMDLPLAVLFFQDGASEGSKSYGGYDLVRGNNDAAKRWGRQDTSAAPAGNHVFQLQSDLAALGFTLVGTPDGGFGRLTEWAIREFQIYAGMRFVAQSTGANATRPLTSLSQAANVLLYTGPVCGVVNAATRIALQYWKGRNWRCPVVVEAWSTQQPNANSVPTLDAPTPNCGNLWHHKDPTVVALANTDTTVMRVRDFSGYYQTPPAHSQILSDPNSLILLGSYYDEGQGGPVSRPGGKYPNKRILPHTWSEAEVTAENLLGKPVAALSPAQRSTFKVVRAVAEVECLGFFDCVNAWDPAVISVGPCHWTLGLPKNAVMGPGELPPYLAYFAWAEPEAYQEAFGRFGLHPGESWEDRDDHADGRTFYLPLERKYVGRVCVGQEDGPPAALPATDGLAEYDYLRTWHWFYRFVMAGRTITAYRRCMWDMARIRLRSFRGVRFPLEADWPRVLQADGTARGAEIGEVFTSEEATGLLHRWHVYRPGDIVNGGLAGARVTGAVAAAITDTAVRRDPSTWTSVTEQALVEALFQQHTQAPAGVQGDLNFALTKVREFPNYASRPHRGFLLGADIGALSADRHSFTPDFSGLPDPPP